MILDAQQLFLMLHTLVGGTPLCYALRIIGEINLERLERSLNNVIEAQPGLSLSFKPLPEGASSLGAREINWEKRDRVSIQFEDRSHSFSEEQVASIYNNLLNKKRMLSEWPLFELILIKTGRDKYILFLGIDHVIADGLSNLQFLDLLFSEYRKPDSLERHSIESYLSVVSSMNNYQPSMEAKAISLDLLKQIKKQGYLWNPEKRSINGFTPNMRTLVSKLSSVDTKQVIQIANNLRVSLYTLIVGAYLDIFFQVYEKEDRIVFTLPTGGKVYPQVDATPFIGCFAQALTLSFTRELMQLSLKDRLQHVHQMIHEGVKGEFDHIQNQKTAQSICRDFALQNGEMSLFLKTLFRSSMKSNVYISYTGYSPIKANYDEFRIEEYQEGTFNNAGVADFMHSVFNDQLHFFANYDEEFFAKETLQNLLDQLSFWFSNLSALKMTSIKTVESDFMIVDPSIKTYLVDTFDLLFRFSVSEEAFLQDLEGKLGIDSLGRIRLITKIMRDYGEQIDQNALFECRSLQELGSILSKQLSLR